jgi:hypothetical protein
MTMAVAIADKKPARKVLTWIAFCVAAVGVTVAEYAISIGLIRTTAILAAKHFAGHAHDQKALLSYILMLPIFLCPNTFALLNPLVITRVANKHQRLFAQAFALSSVWWLVAGVMTIDHQVHLHAPVSDLWKLQVPSASLILAGVLQVCLAIKIAKELKYKDVGELDADEKKQFETAIHNLKQSQNKTECGLLAAQCLQLLALSNDIPSNADDLHTLTRELVRQKRNLDADLISRQYIKLVENSLLS